jgi:hypothetical protein
MDPRLSQSAAVMPVDRVTAAAIMAAPDFVILGVPVENGVVLLASTELRGAELRAEVERDWYFMNDRIAPPPVTYHLRADLKSYVTVVAPNYVAAFERLLRMNWVPKGVKALDA